MSPQAWKDIEQALSHPYGGVRLRADGHVLGLMVERGKGLRFVVAVYIDGSIDFKRCVRPEPDAIERKFWQLKRRYLLTAKQRAEESAMAKKRGLPAEIKQQHTRWAEASVEILSPNWPDARALCRHLRKHCTEFERLPLHTPAALPETTS